MRKLIKYVVTMLAIILVAGESGNCLAQKKATPSSTKASVRSAPAPLPTSLEALYPPKAPNPVFLLSMFEMNKSLTGIVVDLFEGDLDHVKTNFEKFKTQYLATSKLVPEWQKEYYPLKPVEELGTSLQTNDRGQVMAAIGNTGMVCHHCHSANMVKVQQKYHWPDFKIIAVPDPLTNQGVDYPTFMQYLNANFTGIGVDLEQGQVENAQKQFQGFKARFQALKESCGSCHDTERKYYVDEGVQSLIDKLGQALEASSLDPKLVGELSQGIGMESCAKCHLVHLPAAYAKLGMKIRF